MPARSAQTRSVYDWSGFYIGGHVGYGWRQINYFDRLNLVTGLRLPPWSHDSDGTFGGMQIGYNFRVTPTLIVGLEADLSVGNIRGDSIHPQETTHHYGRVRWFSTGRGRVGYSLNNVLIYGTAGLAWIGADRKRIQALGATNFSTLGTVETQSYSKLGWTIGGGLEFGLTSRWSIKAEYLYLASFDNFSDVWPLAQTSIGTDLRAHTARFGLNYRF